MRKLLSTMVLSVGLTATALSGCGKNEFSELEAAVDEFCKCKDEACFEKAEEKAEKAYKALKEKKPKDKWTDADKKKMDELEARAEKCEERGSGM